MRRVLVVDDQACVRELVKQVLEVWEDDQVEVETAEDGVEALHVLGTRTFDLVVCDIAMPHLNGVDLLGKVRQMQYHHDLPILMLTGLGDEVTIAKVIAKGATAFLTKPFNVKDLLDALSTCADWDLRHHPLRMVS